jgi:hypothetical protein
MKIIKRELYDNTLIWLICWTFVWISIIYIIISIMFIIASFIAWDFTKVLIAFRSIIIFSIIILLSIYKID